MTDDTPDFSPGSLGCHEALHMAQFLEMTLPGFRWLSPGSFVLGLIESFLYGAYAGLVFTPIHNFVVRRVG